VFLRCLKERAASVIFVHNHPSGDCNPSESDKEITKELVEAGKIIGITVLDHVIIGKDEFVSLKESGVM
jgi:DNA repair protein RadC